MTEKRTIIEFGGTKFYVTQVTPEYRTLTPVEDANWLLRACVDAKTHGGN